jgi:phage shock protein A
MSLVSRMRLMFSARANAALNGLEDPVETLDYAYQQQQELLRQVNRGLVDVVTAKEQLRQQAAGLRGRIPQLEEQARSALTLGREDLARVALERKQLAIDELAALDAQTADIAAEEQRITAAQRDLGHRIEEFRTHRSILTARHDAATAQLRVNESLTGVTSEFAELGMAVGRAEEKIERLRSRASAVDALLAAGTLAMPGGSDPLERELRDLRVQRTVDTELAAMQQELGDRPDADAPAEAGGDR